MAVPYGDDSDGYYVMTSTEQQQQQQQQHHHQQHSPAADETYRGVVSDTVSTPVTTVAAMDDEPNDRELNLTLPAPTAAAPTTLIP